MTRSTEEGALDAPGAKSGTRSNWRTVLLQMPTDRPRGCAARSFATVQGTFSAKLPLDSDDSQDLTNWFLAAFAVLTFRYSDEERIAVGLIPSHGPVIAVQVDLSGNPKFEEVVTRVQQARAEARTPDTPATNVPQLCFQYLEAPALIGTADGVVENRATPLDAELVLRVDRYGRAVHCRMDYDQALFERGTIDRLLGHLNVLLCAVASDAEAPITILPLLTDAERRLLVTEWNTPPSLPKGPPEKLIHKVFEDQAARTPDAIAVEFQSRRLTYRELNAAANRLAHALRRRGIGPNSLVGICLERSPELPMGIFAILKAGGAFVPIESSYPIEQVNRLLSNTRPKLVLTHSTLEAKLRSCDTPILCLDLEWGKIATEPPTAPDVLLQDKNIAMVLFTSGSTGIPKAIPHCHGPLRARRWIRETFQLSESDRHLLKTSLDSTLLAREILWPLLTGGRMIIAESHESKDAGALLRLLIEHRITIITLVPSLLRLLVAEKEFGACQSLRHVNCFGEPMQPDLEELFCKSVTAKLSIFYGTTETPALTFRQCRNAGHRAEGNLGFRHGSRQIYVVDPRLQLVPIGVPGELLAGGQGMTPGYLAREDLTAERFITHPFSAEPGARLYRTGDRVRWRPDGSLQFIGRVDDQVKIRGYRIEPAEVEASLVRHPGVRETVVTARQNRAGETQLVAYVVSPMPGLTVADVRAHLRKDLPEHMIPSIFVQLPCLPRRPNGKVDRKAMPAPTANFLELGSEYVEPTSSLEKLLVEIYRKVLEVEKVSVHDNFFNLGGHSLLAMKLVSIVRQRTGVDLPVRMIFDSPTPALLSARLAALTTRAQDSQAENPEQYADGRLPVLPNGKVDRRALPAPRDEGTRSGNAYVAPRNALEELVAGVWREVLQLNEVGVHDDFFKRGGHSLLAAQVVARLAKRVKVELPLQRFYENATVAALATELQKRLSASETAPLLAVPRTGPLPLSFAQQRLWFLDRLLPGKSIYNVASLWRLSGALDIQVLQRSLETVIERHESLRTCFVVQDGEPVQVIGAPGPVALPVIDLQAMEPGAREARAQAVAQAEADQPFDLEKGPLIRAQLLRVGAEEHLFLVTLHHIACDGWSMGVLWRELSSAYTAWIGQRIPALAALPIQYADYGVWQREQLPRQAIAGQLAYWRERLAGLSPLELPTDRPRPLVASYGGGQVHFELPPALAKGLQELSRREGATLFMTLLGAFTVLLCRYSRQEDIAVGTPIAGRGRMELEGLIGFLANTLVLRTDLGGNPTFTELLGRVRENALSAYTHQDLPFDKLVEELCPSRDLSRNPLFQVMFVLQNAPEAALALGEVQAKRLPLTRQSAKFDLTLELRQTATGLQGSWEYSRDLFDAGTIQRLAGHFETLLQGIVTDAQQPIGQLPLLTAAERHQLLVGWNDTAVAYPQDRCVHQLFSEQAERTPETVAVVHEGRELTYAALNARANQLAHYLVSLGVGPEVLVGICLERSLELIVGLLGILKAGGAYVPLDPAYPPERLGFMLQDTAAPVLLTQEALLAQLPPYKGQTLCLDRDWPAIALQPADNPSSRTTAQSLAYVIYTSGSTGKPKGVMIEHRGVLRLLFGTEYAQFDAHQVFLMLSPVSFDASAFELWGALLHGARCVIFPDRIPTTEALNAILQHYQVSTLWLTAALFNVVIDQAPQILRGVRQLLVGGEALSPTHVRQALEALPTVQLTNGYGPTESATFTCCYKIPNRLDGSPRSIPIGRPISNTQVRILDERQTLVPIGVVGELYICGDGLARGYLNRPELTAEKFVLDPFSKARGARMYRTGDLARYLPDGNIEFVGRIDHQVKVRGFRIELGEIEAVLAQHEAVRQAVVLAREDITGDKRLVAYVVAVDGATASAEILRAFLRERLPDYMLPSAYVILERLPLTPNGKVDRTSLPAPHVTRTSAPSCPEQPANRLELELLHIWQRLFDRQGIGRFDNFFELGGHSLFAVRLAAEIKSLLGRTLPIAALFHSPTIESLARRLSEEKWMPPWSSLVPLQPQGDKPRLFLAHGWGGRVYTCLRLAQQLGPGQPTFGLQAVGLDGEAPRHTTLETMAAHYVQEIRAFQPEGPYYLGGYSMGGLIAYEMAQQLHRLGQRVAVLALFDSAPVGGMPWTIYGRAIVSHLLSRCAFHLRRWRGMSKRDRLDYLRSRWAVLKYLIAQNRSNAVVVTDLPAVGTQAPEIPGFKDYYYALAAAYRARSYPGTADVFVSEDARPHWVMCWRHLVRGGVSFHPVPGKHLQLLSSEYVPFLAQTLNAVLQSAYEREAFGR